MDTIRSMANTFSCLNIYCVFGTKQRVPALNPDVRERLIWTKNTSGVRCAPIIPYPTGRFLFWARFPRHCVPGYGYVPTGRGLQPISQQPLAKLVAIESHQLQRTRVGSALDSDRSAATLPPLARAWIFGCIEEYPPGCLL